jgi:Mg/Co/Ni transporter MgtE
MIRTRGFVEVGVRHWWRVRLREIPSRPSLGATLGAVGSRIYDAAISLGCLSKAYLWVALKFGVVLVVTVVQGDARRVNPAFVLRRFGIDPATFWPICGEIGGCGQVAH